MSDGRPDFNGSNYDDAFLGDLVNFVASNSFQSMFETYFLSHALFFSDAEEHKLEYMDYYQEFHKLFEEQLELFCTEKKMTQEEFMVRCSEASTDDPKAKHYISILLSSVEYDTFVKLMKIMRPVAERRRAIEAATAAMEAADLEDEAKSGLDDDAETKPVGDEADAKDGADFTSPSKMTDGDKGSPAKGDDGDEDAKGAAPKMRSLSDDDAKGSGAGDKAVADEK